ncbi:caspase, EACC1-associated type [Actinocorallia longicatena]|uniref:Peptidase C14 caspase domain-containing protein n=1 Tax=Actinocorallia longicatena TaxID=111803 RepID=A0ABP6QQU8_9ACTN
MDHSTRRALLIAADRYTDPGLGRLRSPAQDVRGLSGILSDPSIGGFAVTVVHNRASHEIETAIEDFFADARPNDVLLLYFSCHGWKDEGGRLYFATTGTRLDRPNSSAVPAAFVTEQLKTSMCRNIVVLLDCCYSGAFTRDLLHRSGGGAVDVTERFAGSGSAVICSSTSLEYSFEADQGTLTLDPSATAPEPRPSLFTGALIEGLSTGDADLNGDGRVSIDELYDYVYERIAATTPNQTPTKFMDVQGELLVAASPRGLRPAPLPGELLLALESPLPSVRAGAVDTLRHLARPGTPLSAAARDRLTALTDDDSRQVATAAREALGATARPPASVPAPPPRPRRPPPAVPAAPQIAAPQIAAPHPDGFWPAIGAYLLPYFSSLLLARAGRRETRFHAWQCAFIDALTVVSIIVYVVVDLAYLGIRYGSSQPRDDDPVVILFLVTFLVLPCALRLHCILRLVRRSRPRLPVLGPLAEAIAYHGARRTE